MKWRTALPPPAPLRRVPRPVTTPSGRRLTARQYLARLRGRLQAPGGGDPCTYGHHDCALWEGGPCGNELSGALAPPAAADASHAPVPHE